MPSSPEQIFATATREPQNVPPPVFSFVLPENSRHLKWFLRKILSVMLQAHRLIFNLAIEFLDDFWPLKFWMLVEWRK
jgi:hypothetical protein